MFPPFIPLIKSLGAVPINLPMGDIYTAMERGAVDGFVMAHFGFVRTLAGTKSPNMSMIIHSMKPPLLSWLIRKNGTRFLLMSAKRLIAFKKDTVDPAISDYYLQHSDEEWQ